MFKLVITMKMLICDYDGTLNVNDDLLFKIDLKLNIKAIKEFIHDGNTFVISTTRGYKSIKEEISRYKIPYDFVTCNNGSVIFDNKNNLIYANTLSIDELGYIKNTLKEKELHYFDLYGFENYDIQHNIVYVSFRGKSKKQLTNFHVEKRGFHTYIKNKCTKLDGANILKEYLNIDEVYSIGDSKDEVELLQTYNGYKMLFSDLSLWNKNIDTTTSVHKVIKKIRKV